LITGPITKDEARKFIDERDEGEIQKYVGEIDRLLRTSWQGKNISAPTNKQFLPDHVVKRVLMIFGDAGWTISYTKGGSDQREGSWNGHFTIG
jgi:hypothetical protein